jgi:hypothetical protein
MKNLIKKLIFGDKASPETFIKHLKKKGVLVGEGTVVFDPRSTMIDTTRPYLLKIGKNVQITRGVTILTHGYDWSVLKGEFGNVLGSAGEVVIGDNVFIGMNATILKNVHIGNNVIIGANSLVNKNLESDSVYAGNPAKRICSTKEYLEKRIVAQEKEAKEIYRCFVERYGEVPPREIFNEFFWLFWERDKALPNDLAAIMKLLGEESYALSLKVFKETPPKYNGFEEFLSAISKQ